MDCTRAHVAATLGANAVLTGAGITLSGITGGTHSLTLTDSGTSILNGAMSGLTTLQANAVTLNNGNVTSSGTQSYGAATLGANAVLTRSDERCVGIAGGTHCSPFTDSGKSIFNG